MLVAQLLAIFTHLTVVLADMLHKLIARERLAHVQGQKALFDVNGWYRVCARRLNEGMNILYFCESSGIIKTYI